MNPFEMVVLIVALVTVGRIVTARYKHGKFDDGNATRSDPEANRLRDEVKGLKERIAVLERLATDDTSSLERQIEQLRERDRA